MHQRADKNQRIATQLREAAGLLQARGANPFRVGAYRKAANNDEHIEGQHTVVTETRGSLVGRRVVRGREAECRAHYAA